MSENRKWVYTERLPVRWRDMDAGAHVNNSVYFTYFEQARVTWLEQIDIILRDITEGPVVVTCECSYLKQLRYPADLEIKTYVGSAGRSSFMMYYDVYTANDPDVLYAKGSAKVVWINYHLGKSVPLPEKMLKHLPIAEHKE